MLLRTWPLHSCKSCSCHRDRLRTLGTASSCQRTADPQISCGNLSPDKSDASGPTWTGVMTASRRPHRSDRATMACSHVCWFLCVSAPNGNPTLCIPRFAYPSTPNGNQLLLFCGLRTSVLRIGIQTCFCILHTLSEPDGNQIKSIFIIHQYTKYKNENFPLTHGLKTQEGTFKITIK